MTLVKAALFYASCGWRVFPCGAGRKVPSIEKWQLRATSDARQIETWWSVRPDSNVGLACGPDSNLFVIDVDIDKVDGEATLKRLCRRLGPLPASLEQRTGSGGRQVFFRYPATRVLRNTTSKVGQGIDSRGAGGFVVMPPSRHPDGPRYAWITPVRATEPAELPEPWIAKFERVDPPTVAVPVERPRVMDKVGGTIVERRVSDLTRCGKGERNSRLYRTTFYLATRRDIIDWPQAREQLLWAGGAIGLDRQEAEKAIQSAARGAGIA